MSRAVDPTDESGWSDRVLDRARAGRPTLALLQGEAGVGKSTALEELIIAAVDFQVLFAAGSETAATAPFDALSRLGVDGLSPRMAPMVAAQAVRRAVDRVAERGPVLLAVDDLQWVDPESVEAITWLLRRASGDRLLVAVTSRPLDPRTHAGLQRWAETDDAVVRELIGLSEPAARALIDRLRPDLPAPVAVALWRHTGGNPLYLRSLLAEHRTTGLIAAAGTMLPAPAEYTRLVGERVAGLGPAAQRLLRTVSILSDGWVALPDAAAVADLTDVAAAADLLVGAELLDNRDSGVGRSVRVVHSLTRSAVLAACGRGELRDLHLRTAARLDGDPALDHRVAAADRHDDDLAADLVTAARRRHGQGSHRLAAQRFRTAATLCADPARSQALLWEAMVDTLLAPVGRLDEPDRARLAATTAEPAAAVVRSLQELVEGRWNTAYGAALLPDTTAESHGDPLVEYRRQVLLAWSGMASGRPSAVVAEHLARAAAATVSDPAFAGEEARVRVYLAERAEGVAGALRATAALPADPAAVPRSASLALMGRGVTTARMGRLEAAAADLSEVLRRVEDGVLADISNGASTAALAVTQYLRGQWDRAEASLNRAVDLFPRYLVPHVPAVRSLIASVRGDFIAADEHLRCARTMLADNPWPEPARLLVVAEVTRLHAAGDPVSQTGYRPDRAVVRRMLDNPGPPLWEVLHTVQALVWTGHLDDAARLGTALDRQPRLPDWGTAVRSWLSGLIQTAGGHPDRALELFSAAADGIGREVPLLRAHVLADLGRTADALGDRQRAATVTAEAASLYAALGADAYTSRIGSGRQLSTTAPARWALSDREREVLALLTAGLSYAQIARELFVTRSTVGFHLGNVYAKTGVNSRHDLTALVRTDPASFGLLPA